MIEEDDPEITVDTVEDTENFSDDADDDIKNIGGSLVPVSNQKSSRYATKIVWYYVFRGAILRCNFWIKSWAWSKYVDLHHNTNR